MLIEFSPVFWLFVIIALVVVELISFGLTTIWFAIGALVSLGLNLAGFGFWPQIIAFIAVSFVALVTTRPLAIKYLKKSKVKTNIDELPGSEAIVLETIDNLKGTGRVLLRGVDWRAITEDNKVVIEKDETVIVEAVSGVKVIVKKKEEL